jgi:hypothetical protein
MISLVAIRTYRREKDYSQYFWISAVYAPALICFALSSTVGRPDFGVALELCKHWESYNVIPPAACDITGKDPNWALPGAFTSLPWSLRQASSLTLSLSLESIFGWILMFFAMGAITSCVGATAASQIASVPRNNPRSIDIYIENNGFTLVFFIIPLLISSPLYIIGWDLGRWFSPICITFLILSLSKELRSGFDGLRGAKEYRRKPINVSPYVLFSFISLFCLMIRLPHCCIGWNNITSEPFRVIIAYMTQRL